MTLSSRKRVNIIVPRIAIAGTVVCCLWIAHGPPGFGHFRQAIAWFVFEFEIFRERDPDRVTKDHPPNSVLYQSQ